MTDQQEKFNTIVLSRIGFYNLAGMLEMYRRVGSATSVLEYRNDIREIVPEASPKLIDAFKDISELQRRAEEEMKLGLKFSSVFVSLQIESLCLLVSVK